MTVWGSVDFNEFEELRDKLVGLEQSGAVDAFFTNLVKELTARFLALVIPATPVGLYPKDTGKTGGTLRRGWTAEKTVEEYVFSVTVIKSGSSYEIKILNDVEYARYVEYGHRTPGGNGWVVGRFMMTISEIIINQEAPELIKKRLEEFLEGVING